MAEPRIAWPSVFGWSKIFDLAAWKVVSRASEATEETATTCFCGGEGSLLSWSLLTAWRGESVDENGVRPWVGRGQNSHK